MRSGTASVFLTSCPPKVVVARPEGSGGMIVGPTVAVSDAGLSLVTASSIRASSAEGFIKCGPLAPRAVFARSRAPLPGFPLAERADHVILSPLINDRVRQRPNLLDFNAARVPLLEEDFGIAGHADAMGGAGENHRAWEQRRAPGEKLDKRADVEDHVLGAPVLHGLAVEDRLDAEGVRIGDLVRGDEAGAERSEGVKRLAAAPLATAKVLLPVP